jgi:hypothetical protein
MAGRVASASFLLRFTFEGTQMDLSVCAVREARRKYIAAVLQISAIPLGDAPRSLAFILKMC